MLMKNTLTDWKIKDDTPVIITDSGSSMIKAFKLAKTSCDENLLSKTIDAVATGVTEVASRKVHQVHLCLLALP